MLIDQVLETVAYIEGQTDYRPEIALVLGSGLGALADEIEGPVMIAYEDLPHFCQSTAPGHRGQLVIGRLGGKVVLCMQGRLHFYEGYKMGEITYPIRVMAKLGIKHLLLSNAAGGINTAFGVGDLMLVTDHLNFLGTNPLLGPNEGDFGTRFNDMSYAYNPGLLKIARLAAQELDMQLQEGIYLACTGPSYETPAEIRMFRNWGASAVGMSTVPEVIVANHSGIKVMAISCITNMAAGILDQPLTEAEVLETGRRSGQAFGALMKGIVEKIEGGI